MREDEFRRWLLSTDLVAAAQINALSRCRRVERYEGNLDEHFQKDRLAELIDRLTYTAADEAMKSRQKHTIPIDGNVRNGTASLKDAVIRYRKFLEAGQSVDNRPIPVTQILSKHTVDPSSVQIEKLLTSKPNRADWPTWNLLTRNEVLQLARLTLPFVRFLHPDIVAAIVEDNERHRSTWANKLFALGIDPDLYLWEKSSCVFPGVRRHAGSTEVSHHRGRIDIPEGVKDAVKLDDNHFPKQTWSYLLRGKPFSNLGPTGYSLAHLADHKTYKNRVVAEFDVIADSPQSTGLYGLYTSVANTVYTPATLIRPTDFAGPLRNLLQRQATQLYGNTCNLFPPYLRVKEAESNAWALDAFDWSEPVGTMEFVQRFLEFRNEKMTELFSL